MIRQKKLIGHLARLVSASNFENKIISGLIVQGYIEEKNKKRMFRRTDEVFLCIWLLSVLYKGHSC
jgi:hypothetical protein